jgi:Tol biopolymer transport system component
MKRHHGRVLALALVVALAACAPTPDRTETAASVEPSMPNAASPSPSEPAASFKDVSGLIAYRSGSEIRAVDPADPGQTISLGSFHECPFGQVYLNRCGDGDPIGWSLDGTRLLVSIQIEGTGSSIYVLGDDGARTRLSKETHWGAFSPDGSQVVYSHGSWRGPYLVDVDGGTPRSLADPCPRQEVQGELMELCGEPAPEATAWSPDGSTIAWLDFGEGTIPGAGHENFLSFVNPDGTGLREGVATLPGSFGGNSLVWSPDGSRLVFWMADDDDRNAQIFVINADGTGLQQITDEGENQWPAWSPDGSRIAFVRDGALYTMAPDGSDLREVDGVRPDGPIAWNPLFIEPGG